MVNCLTCLPQGQHIQGSGLRLMGCLKSDEVFQLKGLEVTYPDLLVINRLRMHQT